MEPRMGRARGQPRVMFLHHGGLGATQALARGLRAALDHTAARLGAR